VLMGRKTYETVLPFNTWPYTPRPVFVLSTNPLAPAPSGAIVERLSGPPADVIATLAARGFKHLYVDGGATIQGFLRAGLIDRLVISRVPVLIGSGISLFGGLERDIPLRHVVTRVYASGLVQSEYAVPQKRVAVLGRLEPVK
jgi:dihydrofolate reductase